MLQLTGAAPPSLPLGMDAPRHGIFAIFQRRRGLITAIVAGFTLLVAIATILSPKTYTTHVKFIAGSSGATGQIGGQTLLPVLNALIDASNAQSSETYAEMLRQTPALQRTIDQLNLNVTPAELMRHVSVKPVTNTSILDVAVTWRNPQTSADIANALADAFVAVRKDLIGAQARAAIASIEEELPSARDAVQRSAAALAAYESKNGIADSDAQTQAAVASLGAIDTKIAAAEVDRRQAAAQLAVVTQQIGGAAPTVSGGKQVAPNPVVSQLRTQLAQVDVQLQTALQQYTEAHPAVQALRAQKAELEKSLASTPATIVAADNTVANPVRQQLTQQAASLRSQTASDDAQLATLKSQRAAAEPAMRRLPLRAAEVAQLKRQAKLDEDVYNALQQKYDDAKVAVSTTLSDVSVIARATPDGATVQPNRLLDLGLGFLIACVLGILGALVAERFDNTVKTQSDVTDRLALPVLAEVPMLPARGDTPGWLRAAMIDSFLQLVTSLRYASSERLHTIAFTSPGASDGKSLVALDTAIALAELQPRVLLIDADLRLPSLHAKLGMTRDPGLSDVLVGTAAFEEAVQTTRHDGLDVVTGGTRVPNAFSLLQSPAFDRFLETARERYDTIVLDTPACGSVVDAAVVCVRADGVVYVVASGETEAGEAERGLARLRNAGVRNLLGAVLNKVSPRRSTIGAYGEVTEGTRAFPAPPPRGGTPSIT